MKTIYLVLLLFQASQFSILQSSCCPEGNIRYVASFHSANSSLIVTKMHFSSIVEYI